MSKKLMVFIKKETICAIEQDFSKSTELLQKGYKLLFTTTDQELEFANGFELITYQEAITEKPNKAKRIWDLIQEELKD